MTTPYTITVVAQPSETADRAGGLYHRNIAISAAIDPLAEHGNTLAELLHGFRWAAGIIARSALAVGYEVNHRGVDHGCSRWTGLDDDGREPCGHYYWPEVIGSDLTPQRVASGERPWAELRVPGEEVEKWCAYIMVYIGKVIEADKQPADTVPQPKHSSVIPDTRQALSQGAGNA